MYCTQCRTELPDGSQFCSKCGHATTAAAAAPKNLPVSGIAAALAVILLAVVIVVKITSSVAHTPPIATRPTSQPPLQYVPQPRAQNITDTAFTVKAGGYTYFQFSVLNADSTNVFVDGHFSATGGSGNDIEVFILNQDEFVNLQNGHQTATFYNSQRVTQNSINAVLPPGVGTYYLVFNNGFSLLTPKAVRASAVLHYTN